MRIHIKDDYYLTSDSRNVMLAKRFDRKDGNGPTYNGLTYHNTVEGALQSYKKIQVLSSDASSLEEVLELAREIDKHLEGLINENTK